MYFTYSRGRGGLRRPTPTGRGDKCICPSLISRLAKLSACWPWCPQLCVLGAWSVVLRPCDYQYWNESYLLDLNMKTNVCCFVWYGVWPLLKWTLHNNTGVWKYIPEGGGCKRQMLIIMTPFYVGWGHKALWNHATQLNRGRGFYENVSISVNFHIRDCKLIIG